MSRTRSVYWQGVRAGAPFLLVVAPFGMLFGVVATEAGFSLIQTMAMTALVIAGAAQFASVQLLVDGAPVFVAILTGLAVNLRMVMYSASLTPHIGKAQTWHKVLMAYFMVDQSYGVSIEKYERSPEMPLADKVSFFFGVISAVAPFWYGFSLVGALLGSAIAPEYALDFAIPITFIAIIAPNLRSLPHLAASIVSVVVALALYWMPYNLWLMVAAVLAMITGAQVEKWLEARK
ncbi:MAG: AzlC family ABC transporter permease [Rhodobacteraceae bacterium]|nr:AzlC family ABC transporter permease [Paracoccaceae bacterium]